MKFGDHGPGPVSVAVVGYASVDRAITVATPLRAGRTAIVTGRRDGSTGSGQTDTDGCGGIGYAATELARGGTSTHAVTWIGDDAAGQDYRNRLACFGVHTDGIEVAGPTSPSALMVYDPDGVCTCLFDPGSGAAEQLTSSQRGVVAATNRIVLMVAPAAITAEVLDVVDRGDRRGLTFVMKADEQAQPDGTCAAAVARADSVFCNHIERELIAPWLHAGHTVVTTAGAGAVRMERGGRTTLVENPEVLNGPLDLTGAGDTLAGACLAGLLAGAPIDNAVRTGMAAATRLLRARLSQSQ